MLIWRINWHFEALLSRSIKLNIKQKKTIIFLKFSKIEKKDNVFDSTVWWWHLLCKWLKLHIKKLYFVKSLFKYCNWFLKWKMIDISNGEIIVRWHHDVTRHGSQDCHNFKAFMLCKVRWKYNILIFDEIGSNHYTTIDHLWFKLILDSPQNI